MTAKDAVTRAMTYAVELFTDAEGIRLEELERSGQSWQVTLSFQRKGTLGFLASLPGSRDYKVFTVRDQDGEVTSVKVRELSEQRA
jgi:hypothetical protein